MDRIQASARRWSLPLTALMLVAPLLLGVHHHEDGLRHEACVACTLAHAPALASQTATAPARPHQPIERVDARSERIVVRTPATVPPSRAPPAA